MPRIRLLKKGNIGQRRCTCGHLLIQHRLAGIGLPSCQARNCKCDRYEARPA